MAPLIWCISSSLHEHAGLGDVQARTGFTGKEGLTDHATDR
jgi:hypothetical protein